MGHVYLLKARRPWEGKILVKIGMTSKRNVHDRVNQIKQEWLRDRRIVVDYVASFTTQNPNEAESKLHREWEHRSVYGKHMQKHYGGDCSGDSEWFAVSPKEFRSLCKDSRRESSGGLFIIWAIAVLAAVWVLFSMTPKKPIQKKSISPIAPVQVQKTPRI